MKWEHPRLVGLEMPSQNRPRGRNKRHRKADAWKEDRQCKNAVSTCSGEGVDRCRWRWPRRMGKQEAEGKGVCWFDAYNGAGKVVVGVSPLVTLIEGARGPGARQPRQAGTYLDCLRAREPAEGD